MAEQIEISITSEDVLSLKQACQVIISEYRRCASDLIVEDENGIYPLILEQGKGLKADVEAGVNSIDSFDKLTLEDVQRPSTPFGELSSFADITKVEGNYPISQSVYDEASAEVKDITDGLKRRETPKPEEVIGSNFQVQNLINKIQSDYPESSFSDGSQNANPETINQAGDPANPSNAARPENIEQGTATFNRSIKGAYKNTIREECIPCTFRIDSLDGLDISSDMLFMMEDLLEKYRGIIDQWKQLLTNTDIADDICSLLNFLKTMCPIDLYALIALLTALLTKYRDLIPNLDGAFLNFIAPFFSPILNGLSDILDKYIQLIMRPIDCIINNLDTILSRLDVQRGLDQAEVANISFHRKREGYLRRKIEQLEERRSFLNSQKAAGVSGTEAPKYKIGGRPRGNDGAELDALLGNEGADSPRYPQMEITGLPGSVTIDEELGRINEDLEKARSEYRSEYGENGSNNISELIRESQTPPPALLQQLGQGRGKLRDVRNGIASGLYELRGQALNGRRMINDTLRVVREEINRLVSGRAATSTEMLEGVRNIQRVSRLIGLCRVMLKIANGQNICDNSNNDPSVALGSFLTANKSVTPNDGYYNVYIGQRNGENQLLIAPSGAELEVAAAESDDITQLTNLDEINKLNADGIPGELGDITDKKITGKVQDLGVEVPVTVVEFDLCTNKDFSGNPRIDDIESWAVNAGFNL